MVSELTITVTLFVYLWQTNYQNRLNGCLIGVYEELKFFL